MNLGIGYELLSGFLRSQNYYWLSVICYAVLITSPLIFWKFAKTGVIFVSCMSIAFVLVKLLTLYVQPRDPDEGVHLGMAADLLHGGRPFRDFEGNSAGPFNAYYLALFAFGNVSYVTARLAALFAQLACGVLSFFAARKLCGVKPAITVLSMVFFYFSMYYPQIIFYNSETPFCLLISVWLFLFAYRRGRISGLFAECFIAGLMPWIKLQFVPFAVTCFILSLARGVFAAGRAEYAGSSVLLQHAGGQGKSLIFRSLTQYPAIKSFLIACFSAILPTLIFISYLAMLGAFDRFWLFYILGNVQAATRPAYLKSVWPFLVNFANSSGMFGMATCTAVAFMILSLSEIKSAQSCQSLRWFLAIPFKPYTFIVKSSHGPKDLGILLLIFVVLVALFTFTRPLRPYEHYINILVPSSVIFIVLGLAFICHSEKRTRWAFSMLVVTVAVFGIKLTTPLIDGIVQYQNALVHENYYAFKDVIQYLNKNVKAGEPVAVWGAETRFLTFSGHPPATAINLIDEMFGLVSKDRMREEYAKDIINKKPAAIVDLVNSAAIDFKVKKFELQNYEFIRKVTDEYYQKPVSIPVWDGFVRVYLRK